MEVIIIKIEQIISREPTPEIGQQLPGGAVIIDRLEPDWCRAQLAKITNQEQIIFRPDARPEHDNPLIKRLAGTVHEMFPESFIRCYTTHDQFDGGQPLSLLGIHNDGYPDGFFVLSDNEATVLHERDGSNPQQAPAGAFVYVPTGCFHSSPRPEVPGERYRIKFVPSRTKLMLNFGVEYLQK